MKLAITQISPQLFPMLLSHAGDLLYQQSPIYQNMKLEALRQFASTLATKAKELNDKVKDIKASGIKHQSHDPLTLFKALTTLSPHVGVTWLAFDYVVQSTSGLSKLKIIKNELIMNQIAFQLRDTKILGNASRSSDIQ